MLSAIVFIGVLGIMVYAIWRYELQGGQKRLHPALERLGWRTPVPDRVRRVLLGILTAAAVVQVVFLPWTLHGRDGSVVLTAYFPVFHVPEFPATLEVPVRIATVRLGIQLLITGSLAMGIAALPRRERGVPPEA